MKRIYKYDLALTERQGLVLPKGAKIVHVANQREVITIWAEVDPDYRETDRHGITIVGTGHAAPEPDEDGTPIHIGTVLMAGGDFVWHVYITPAKDAQPV